MALENNLIPVMEGEKTRADHTVRAGSKEGLCGCGMSEECHGDVPCYLGTVEKTWGSAVRLLGVPRCRRSDTIHSHPCRFGERYRADSRRNCTDCDTRGTSRKGYRAYCTVFHHFQHPSGVSIATVVGFRNYSFLAVGEAEENMKYIVNDLDDMENTRRTLQTNTMNTSDHPHKSFVLSSDSRIHLSNASLLRILNPTLNGLGSVVNAVGILLHSNASNTG